MAEHHRDQVLLPAIERRTGLTSHVAQGIPECLFIQQPSTESQPRTEGCTLQIVGQQGLTVLDHLRIVPGLEQCPPRLLEARPTGHSVSFPLTTHGAQLS